MRTFAPSAPFAVAVALALAACGDKASAPAAAPPAPQPQAAPAPGPAPRAEATPAPAGRAAETAAASTAPAEAPKPPAPRFAPPPAEKAEAGAPAPAAPPPPASPPAPPASAHGKVGPDKCRMCHRVQHESWAASPHAAKGLDCEGCHGNGADYWSASVMRDRPRAEAAGLVMPTLATCRKCHGAKADAALFARVHAHKAG